MDSRFEWKLLESVSFEHIVQNRAEDRSRPDSRRRQLTHRRRIVKLGSDIRNDTILSPPAIQFPPKSGFPRRKQYRESGKPALRIIGFFQFRRGYEMHSVSPSLGAKQRRFQRGRCRLVRNHDVELVGGQGGKKLTRQSFPHHNFQARSFLPTTNQNMRGEKLRHSIADSEIDRLCPTRSAALNDLHHFIAKCKNALGVTFHDSTSITQNQTFSLPTKKLHFQKALQLPNLRTESRRRNMQRFGCGLDSALGCNG